MIEERREMWGWGAGGVGGVGVGWGGGGAKGEYPPVSSRDLMGPRVARKEMSVKRADFG